MLDNGREGSVIAKEIPMSSFDFTLGLMLRNKGTPAISLPGITYHGVDDDTLKVLMRISDANLAAANKAANQGGPLSVVMTREVIALSGGGVPSPAKDAAPTNGSVSLDGLTWNTFCDFEDVLDAASKELRAMGRAHAAKKDAPKAAPAKPTKPAKPLPPLFPAPKGA